MTESKLRSSRSTISFHQTVPWAVAGLLAALLAAPPAFGLDEIGEPAGDIPESQELPPEGTEPETAPQAASGDESQGGEAETPKTGITDKAHDKAAFGKGRKKKSKDDALPENWDSYSDVNNQGSMAQEITKGVRVEDIVEPPSDYRYAAFGKPDPFVPPLVTAERPSGPNSLEIPIVSPLQRFAVRDLRLVGVWQLASGERKAMVMTPSRGAEEGGSTAGEGIIIKNGDPIGTHGGKILGIGDDFLTVREFSLAPDGTRQYEDQQMYMGKRNPDDQPGKIIFRPGAKETEVKIEGTNGTPLGGFRGEAQKAVDRLGAPSEGKAQNEKTKTSLEPAKDTQGADLKAVPTAKPSAYNPPAPPAPAAPTIPVPQAFIPQADVLAPGAASTPGTSAAPAPVAPPTTVNPPKIF